MKNIVDAKGLSCPQPVLLTLEEIKKANSDEITVLVDTNASKENVIRAVESRGWRSEEVQEVEDGYKISLRKDK